MVNNNDDKCAFKLCIHFDTMSLTKLLSETANDSNQKYEYRS